MSNIHLILGGARSGKSRYAEQLALSADNTLHYVATAQAHDEEMQARIAHHQSQRNARFLLHEVPFEIPSCIAEYSQQSNTVVVDCLTLWVSNMLIQENGESIAESKRQELLNALLNVEGDVILVSNEVSMGIVPMGELSRRFVDETGRLHQEIAGIANNVTLMVAGLAHPIKS